MSDRITTDHVEVQVETDRADVWVPDGLAVATRTDDPVAYDLTRGLAVRDEGGVSTAGDWTQVKPLPTRSRPPVTWITVDTDGTGSDKKVVRVDYGNSLTIGPIMAHTRVPVPVRPGMQASMSGSFRLRQTGSKEKDTNNTMTALFGVARLYGLGTAVDEYGAETEVTEILATHEAQLQAPFTLGGPYTGQTAKITFTIPQTWVTVPAHVDRLHLAIYLRNSLGDPHSGTYDTSYWFQPIDMHYFQCPKVDSATVAPLRIHLRRPPAEHPTYPHPLSHTGYAFRNRTVFENITPGVEITAMGDPGAAPLEIAVHAWTLAGGRGALLRTITVPTDTRVVAPVEHTGAVELVCPSTFYVESVLAPLLDTDTVEQTRLHRYTYTPVTDPVAAIRTQLVEADLGISTVRFLSDTVAATVAAGKRLRVRARHAGGYTTLVTGTIRGRRLVPGLTRPAEVEISVHDDWHKTGAACPVAYDQLAEYGPLVHRLGAPVSIDGVDYTGPAGPLPNGHDFFPSYHSDSQTMRDALLMTRNARTAYLYVDRAGRVQLTATLPDVIDLELSDQPEQGDLSYSTDLALGFDSAELVNTVQTVEHLLDSADYLDARTPTGDPPMRWGPIASKTQRIDYRRESSVELYGESKVSIPVVRGTGTWSDVADRNFGAPFDQWAAAILDTTATETTRVTTLSIPVGPGDVAKVAPLQPFSLVVVRLQGGVWVLRVREVRHEIDAGPGRWLCKLDFTAGGDRVYWLPDPPPAPELPVVGGFYDSAGTGSYDGGDPAGTGVGIIDGGEV